MRFFTSLFLLFIAATPSSLAQSCSSIQGMTPQTAIAVCGTTTFVQPFVNNCTGPNVGGACPGGFQSGSSYWYKFHCYAPGLLGLGFIIKPVLGSDDFDWGLFDVTGHTDLNDIFSTPSMQVSVNISGNLGQTGCIPGGFGNFNCSPDPEYNQLAAMQAGHDYMLMVTNWSATGQGYSISFTGGDALITNNTPPVITSVSTVGCNTSLLKVVFSKDIKCPSVTVTGSEFSLTPIGPVVNAAISSCSSPLGTITELTVQLQNPLAAGSYNLVVNPGTDGETFVDACGDSMAIGFQVPFTVTAITPVAVNNITYTGCAPTVLNVNLTKPVLCNSITPNGSEFSIIPGNPAIASVQSSCISTGTYTGQLQVVLQNPLPHGNYQLVINSGADGNTFIDTCNNQMVAVSIPFTINQVTTAPVIQSVVFDECHPDKVVVNFDKPVNCASLTAAGSELSIGPGNWPINSITYNCTAGIYTAQVTLNLLTPLPGGNFAINVNNGVDGNTLSDTCYAFIPAGYTRSFTTTQAPVPVFDSVQFDKCDPSFVKIFYNHAIKCSSVSANGSDYSITGPSTVTINAAITDVTCASGYTNWVLLQFAQPINTFGNYVLHNQAGTDGNSIIDTCSAIQDPAETISFTALVKPSAVFNSQVNWGCVMDTIVLSHPGGNGINSWTWNFSDGSSASGQNISHIFPVATATAGIQLIVSNGFCSDTVSNTVTLGNAFQAGFTNIPSDTFCINTPVNFTNTSSGTALSYVWDFGDATQFNGQNPPTHVYTISNIYNVQLTATDSHGCISTASKLLHVSNTAFIDFTGLKPQYCTGNQVVLTRKIASTIDSYVWDNGDGKTFTNEVNVNFSYPNEGVYTITLTGNDRYCGLSQVSKTVPVYAVPVVHLGPDTVLCQSDIMLIGVTPNANYTYIWNTGATTAQLYTDIFTRHYTLTADNHGCRGYDDLAIKVLSACLIKVPGAFTPNGDRLNDQLRAVNADLAKNFSLQVFNRLGQMVFSTHNPLEGWNGYYKGNAAETGAYVWLLSYTDPWTGKEVKEKGTSILLR